MNPDPNPNPNPNRDNPNNLLDTIILLGYNVRIGCALTFCNMHDARYCICKTRRIFSSGKTYS